MIRSFITHSFPPARFRPSKPREYRLAVASEVKDVPTRDQYAGFRVPLHCEAGEILAGDEIQDRVGNGDLGVYASFEEGLCLLPDMEKAWLSTRIHQH